MAEKEPTWAVVLHAIYEKGMAGDEFDKHGNHKMLRKAAIADEVDRDQGEVGRALSQMRDQGLVNEPSRNLGKGYTLTEKGFDVAHTRELRRQEYRRERKREKRQHKREKVWRRRQQEIERQRDKRQHDVNRAIGFLTLALVFIGFLQAAITVFVNRAADPLAATITIGVGGVIILVITILLIKTGMLAPWDERDH